MSTIEPFTQNPVPILDSSKSLAGYIRKVDLVDRPSVVDSKNDTKAAQTGGGCSVLQLLYLPISYTTISLAGDTRR